jgi:hypothetical protein
MECMNTEEGNMFGKKSGGFKGGGGFSAKTSLHTHMMRQLWPKGTGTMFRDHMISVHEKRRKEGLPVSHSSKPARPFHPKGGKGPR